MLLVTRTFLTQRIRDTIELLAQDGLYAELARLQFLD